MAQWPTWLGGSPAEPPMSRATLARLIGQAEGGTNAHFSGRLHRHYIAGELSDLADADPLMKSIMSIIGVYLQIQELEAAQSKLTGLEPQLASTNLAQRIEALIAVHDIFARLHYAQNRSDLTVDGRHLTADVIVEELRRLALERYEELLAASPYDSRAFRELGDLLHSQGWYDRLDDIIDALPSLPDSWDDLVALHDPVLVGLGFVSKYSLVWPQVLRDISCALRTNDLLLGARMLADAASRPARWAEYPIGNALVQLQIMVDRLREQRLREAATAAAYDEEANQTLTEEATATADSAPAEVASTDSATAEPAPTTD